MNKDNWVKRKQRVRAKISGSASLPRLNVSRSNRRLYVQLIDDVAATTLVAAGSWEITESKVNANREVAQSLGELIAKKALTKGITKVVFDRGGFPYLGRVKAVAEGARKGGLRF